MRKAKTEQSLWRTSWRNQLLFVAPQEYEESMPSYTAIALANKKQFLSNNLTCFQYNRSILLEQFSKKIFLNCNQAKLTSFKLGNRKFEEILLL